MKLHMVQAGAVVLALAVPATGQSQKVVPPKTVYWMSATTQSGFGMNQAPSAADMMRMATGGGGGTLKSLALDLGSKLPPSPAPGKAEHGVPASMNMGATLPLRAPKKATPSTGSEDFERPKGKLLLFWGCGEKARPGQPVVFDFAKMAAGQMPANLFGGERVRIARPPSASTWPTYVYWPNGEPNGAKQVPQNASLLGEHKVTGNFAPQMDFSLQQDWMQGVNMSQQKLPSGAVGLQWNVVTGATAHFAQMMSGKDEGGAPTIIFWSSSESQTFFSGMSDFVSPSEAGRLVGKKQLMPSSQTSCAIPKEAVDAAAEAGIIMLTSHGPEQNIIHPPRPKDPKVNWVQEWSVKARFVSRSGAIIGMEDMGGGGGGSAATASGKPRCKPDASTEAGKEAGGVMGGSLGRAMGGALGGMMGKKKKPQEDCEP